MEETTPIEEPIKQTAPTVAPMEEATPMEEPDEELATPTAMASGPTEEPDVPPVTCEGKEKGEVPCSGFPGWMEVWHPSQTVTPAGQAPSDSWQVEVAMPQPECGRKESSVLQSQGMQTGHTGGR